MPPLFPSFNKKALVRLLNLSIWDSLKIFMEEQLRDPWQPFKPPSAGLVFFLNILSKSQVRAVKNKFLTCRAFVLLQLEISPRSGQSPRRSEGGQLVQNFLDYMSSDGQLMRKRLIESMVLQVHTLHMGNGDSSHIPCFFAQFVVQAHQCGDNVFAQRMVIWSDVWCCSCHQLLLHLNSDVAIRLLMIYSNWYDKLNLYFVLPLKILVTCFRPMVIPAQGVQCHNWNAFPSVSLWSQVNIKTIVLRHQLCSRTMNEIDEQERFWNYMYVCVCSIINIGGSSPSYKQDCLFMSLKCTWISLPGDLLVEDAREVLMSESNSYMHNLYMTLMQIIGNAIYTIEHDLTSKFSCTRLY
jgi:hypothetical protein